MENELAPLEERRVTTNVDGFSSQNILSDVGKMRAMQELAGAMAQAAITVPQHFRGKAGDCLAVVMQAAQWGMNPFAVAQKTHVVNGQLGYEAQLVNAVVQASGAIHGRFHYEYRGDGASLECRVGAVIHGETAITFNEWLSTSSVAVKNSPLWKTNPRQQLGYLQVKNWARQYTPGAILGVYTPDELAQAEPLDMGVAEVVIKEKPSSSDRKELAPYPAEKFDENLSTWDEAIRAGKTTASRVIAMVSSKYLLSEAQCAAIRELGAAPVPAAEQEIDPFVADMEAAENMLGEQA